MWTILGPGLHGGQHERPIVVVQVRWHLDNNHNNHQLLYNRKRPHVFICCDAFVVQAVMIVNF